MARNYSFSPRVAERLTDEEKGIHGNVHLGWWLNLGDRQGAELLARYADTYFEATSRMLENFLNQPAYCDDEALPILYSLSHALELGLKSAYEFRRLLNPTIEKVACVHKLDTLVESLRYACEEMPTTTFLLDDTVAFVKKVENFNSGHAFRYPFEKKFDVNNEAAWKDTPIVPMAVLRRECEIHCAEIRELYWRLRDEWVNFVQV